MAAVLAALSVTMMAGGLVLATSSTARATSVAADTVQCGTPGVDAYDELVVDTPAKAAYDQVIHHAAVPAVTHVVHHDAVTTTGPGQRYSWNPKGPTDESDGPGPDSTPLSDPGHWQANTSTYHQGDPLGVVFQSGAGNGGNNASWFYWSLTQVVTHPAYDETVVEMAAKDAYDETVHHDAVPAVTHTVHHAAVPAGPPCPADDQCLPGQEGGQEGALTANGEDPCLVAPDQATVNQPTCHTAGSIVAPAAQPGVDVQRTVLGDRSVRFVSTPQAGYHFAGQAQSLEQTVKALPRKTGSACGDVEGVDGGNPKPSVQPTKHVPGAGSAPGAASAPVVLGNQAAVPTAVDAGLPGLQPTSGDSTRQLVGQGLLGAGLVLLVGAASFGLGRRERAVVRS